MIWYTEETNTLSRDVYNKKRKVVVRLNKYYLVGTMLDLFQVLLFKIYASGGNFLSE